MGNGTSRPLVIVVMGVSGSGKSAVGSALAARLEWTFLDADDLHPAVNVEKMRHGIPLTEEDRKPWMQAVSRAVHDRAASGASVLACSALAQWQRDVLRAGMPAGADIRFVYLKGASDEIDRRLRARVGHFMPESLLRSQLQALEEPDATEALAVDVHPPVPAIVETIVRELHLADA